MDSVLKFVNLVNDVHVGLHDELRSEMSKCGYDLFGHQLQPLLRLGQTSSVRIRKK